MYFCVCLERWTWHLLSISWCVALNTSSAWSASKHSACHCLVMYHECILLWLPRQYCWMQGRDVEGEMENIQGNASLLWPHSTVCLLILFSFLPPKALSMLIVNYTLTVALMCKKWFQNVQSKQFSQTITMTLSTGSFWPTSIWIVLVVVVAFAFINSVLPKFSTESSLMCRPAPSRLPGMLWKDLYLIWPNLHGGLWFSVQRQTSFKTILAK